jgi:hypothetical protein
MAPKPLAQRSYKYLRRYRASMKLRGVDEATVIASVAILVSLGTFVWTHRASKDADRRGRMPVLVLFPVDGAGWRLENIGTGAALNIVIAQGRGAEATGGLIELRGEVARRHDGVAPGETWCNPIHLRPMSAGSGQTVPWRFSSSGVGISYTDALGYPYTVRTSKRGTRLTEKLCLPDWPHGEWEQLSAIEALSPNGLRAKEQVPWGVRPERTSEE